MGQIFSIGQGPAAPTYHLLDQADLDWDKQYIVLQNRNLTSPPNTSRFPGLDTIDLTNNRLTEAPDVRRHPNLKNLWLQNNGLTEPPNTRQNGKLEVLNLAYNHLIECPDVSQNGKLELLELSNNCLTELHDSIFSLSRSCEVLIYGNHFTMDYLHRLDECLAQHRAEHPGQGPLIRCIGGEQFQALCR